MSVLIEPKEKKHAKGFILLYKNILLF